MPQPTGQRPPLSGRVKVDHLDTLIREAAGQAHETMVFDLAPYSGLTPSAFNQLTEACRSALDDLGNGNADILLLSVPVPLRDLHQRIAARHGRSLTAQPDGAWRLEPR